MPFQHTGRRGVIPLTGFSGEGLAMICATPRHLRPGENSSYSITSLPRLRLSVYRPQHISSPIAKRLYFDAKVFWRFQFRACFKHSPNAPRGII